MHVEEVKSYFMDILQVNPEISAAVAAIQTLIKYIKQDTSETMVGLRANLTTAIKAIKETDSCVTSVSSGCELFLRFITLTSRLEHSNFEECKHTLVERGELYLKRVESSRAKIAKLCHPFILDGATILTHSRSRVVLQTLLEAANAKKRFRVFITESCPDKSGFEMQQGLQKAGIPCNVILDAAMGSENLVYIKITQIYKEMAITVDWNFPLKYVKVGMKKTISSWFPDDQSFETGTEPNFYVETRAQKIWYVMEKVDLVLVGAEGVVESGGIINKIGSYTLAVCASQMNKPFYVLAESFKFVRLFPLNQQDVPNQFKYLASTLHSNADLANEHPLVDYTPPTYITLLFTDLGILTPSAVSDVLISLYL